MIVTVSTGSTPAKVVPSSWAIVGLLVLLNVIVRQRVMWL